LARIALATTTTLLCMLATANAVADAPKPLKPPTTEFVADADAFIVNQRPPGLSWKIATGATANFGDVRNVPGQTSGTSVTLGIKFDGNLDENYGKHELRTLASLAQGVTRTPVLPEFVKSADSLMLQAIYLYHFVEWAGLFARSSLQTSMYRGADVRPPGYQFAIARANGSQTTAGGAPEALNRLVLSDPFRPIMLKESIGPFARPLSGTLLNFEIRAGLGGRQTFAAGQLALEDDATKTPTVIEVKELGDVKQIGGEIALSTWGDVAKKRVSYRVDMEMMVPLQHNPLTPTEIEAIHPGSTEQPSALELINIDIFAKLSFKLVDWASVDYELKAIRQPQLLSSFQIQNNLLLTFGLSRASPPAAAPAASTASNASTPPVTPSL
jgi:hypothetical protein